MDWNIGGFADMSIVRGCDEVAQSCFASQG